MSEDFIPDGYYLKARVIQRSRIMRQPPHVREVWDYLLMNANHADNKYGGYKVKRGQLFRTYNQIREDLSWNVGWRKEMYNENQMKKAMKFLREALMITTMKEPGGVLITILNYDKYQDPKNYERTRKSTSERTIAEPSLNQTVPYNKNGRMEEEKEGKSNISSANAADHFSFPGENGLSYSTEYGYQQQMIGFSGPSSSGAGYSVPVGSGPGSGKGKKKNGKNGQKSPLVAQVIEYLNERAGRKYSADSRATRRHIEAREKDGYQLEDFQRVIDNKVAQWGKDPYWQKYLRPSTLFAGKFDEYLNEPGGGGQASPSGQQPKMTAKQVYMMELAEAITEIEDRKRNEEPTVDREGGQGLLDVPPDTLF